MNTYLASTESLLTTPMTESTTSDFSTVQTHTTDTETDETSTVSEDVSTQPLGEPTGYRLGFSSAYSDLFMLHRAY